MLKQILHNQIQMYQNQIKSKHVSENQYIIPKHTQYIWVINQ